MFTNRGRGDAIRSRFACISLFLLDTFNTEKPWFADAKTRATWSCKLHDYTNCNGSVYCAIPFIPLRVPWLAREIARILTEAREWLPTLASRKHPERLVTEYVFPDVNGNGTFFAGLPGSFSWRNRTGPKMLPLLAYPAVLSNASLEVLSRLKYAVWQLSN